MPVLGLFQGAVAALVQGIPHNVLILKDHSFKDQDAVIRVEVIVMPQPHRADPYVVGQGSLRHPEVIREQTEPGVLLVGYGVALLVIQLVDVHVSILAKNKVLFSEISAREVGHP